MIRDAQPLRNTRVLSQRQRVGGPQALRGGGSEAAVLLVVLILVETGNYARTRAVRTGRRTDSLSLTRRPVWC